MDNLITIFKQTDSDAEHIYNPNLIIGSQLAWRGLMHVRCTDLSLRSKCNLFSHQLLLEAKPWNGEIKRWKEIIGTQKWIHKSQLIRQNNYGH